MARYRAISTGNYSVIARWQVSTDGGLNWTAAIQLPTIADDVYPNGFTVTIDVDSFASFYSTRAVTGVSAGGSFPIGAANTITGDAYGGTTACITYSGSAIKTIIGDLFGSNTTALAAALDNTSSSGIVNVVGNATGGSVNGAYGIYNRSTGQTHIVGESIGGTSSNVPGLHNGVNPGNGGACSASVSRASNLHAGITSLGNTVTVGTAISNAAVSALRSSSAGADFIVTTAVCTGGQFICDVPTRVKLTTNATIQFPMTTNALGTFTEVNNQDQASPVDVRLGTTYANGSLTGTCAVPPAGSVALSVPVDNSVGSLATAAVVAADLLNEIATSSIPLAERLRNVATTSTVNSAVGSINVIP
jgi:hypothetical protein